MNIDIFSSIKDINNIITTNKLKKYNIIKRVQRKRIINRLLNLVNKIDSPKFVLSCDLFLQFADFAEVNIIDSVTRINENITHIKLSVEDHYIYIKLNSNGIIKIAYSNNKDSCTLNSEYVNLITLNNEVDKEIHTVVRYCICCTITNYIKSWNI